MITKKTTIREFLQILGTDCLRNNLHSNIHVASTLNSIDEKDNIIITDTRFPNELAAVKERDGITIKVIRSVVYTKVAVFNEHPSETALDTAEFDYTIENNGNIEELIEKVKQILIKENILKNE